MYEYVNISKCINRDTLYASNKIVNYKQNTPYPAVF